LFFLNIHKLEKSLGAEPLAKQFFLTPKIEKSLFLGPWSIFQANQKKS